MAKSHPLPCPSADASLLPTQACESLFCWRSMHLSHHFRPSALTSSSGGNKLAKKKNCTPRRLVALEAPPSPAKSVEQPVGLIAESLSGLPAGVIVCCYNPCTSRLSPGSMSVVRTSYTVACDARDASQACSNRVASLSAGTCELLRDLVVL